MSEQGGFPPELSTFAERDQPFIRRFLQRRDEGDARAERGMRQYKAGELRAREAMMIGGVPCRATAHS